MKRIRATDIYTILDCDRRLYLDDYGDRSLRLPPSSYDQWIMTNGRDYQEQVVASMAPVMPRYDISDLEAGFALTLEMMQSGAKIIYQGVLLSGDRVGIPDLMFRTAGASRFGSYHYRPADIKSSKNAKLAYELQVMYYAQMLDEIQGFLPEGSLLLQVPPEEQVNGEFYREEVVAFDPEKLNRKLGEIRALKAGNEPRPFITSGCKGCGWRDVCIPQAEARQDASLLSGLKRQVWEEMINRGITTLPDVAAADAGTLADIRGLGRDSARKFIRQAKAMVSGQVIRLRRPELPSPAGNDAFFDVESIPSESLIYLMGTLVFTKGEPEFVYELAENPAQEQAMWHKFLARMDALGGWVYHYSSYERTVIRKLSEKYGQDARAEALLQRLIDLEKVLKASAVLPLRGYSLKVVAPWLGFEWSGNTQAADDSMLEYQHWLDTGNRIHIDNILHYNEDDVKATQVIRDWLLTL